MLPFRNSVLADEDLIEILEYTYENWGHEQQEKYLWLLEKGRERICKDPFLINSKSRDDLATGCRSYKVEEHYFFYRVRKDVVEVARVLHKRMDFTLQMREEYFPS